MRQSGKRGTMSRIIKFRERRIEMAKTEYTLFERINNISDKLEELSSRLDDMSERLYELAKEPKEIFDDAPVYNIPRALWYEDTDKRKPDKETIYVRPDGTEYIWLDDMWVRI